MSVKYTVTEIGPASIDRCKTEMQISYLTISIFNEWLKQYCAVYNNLEGKLEFETEQDAAAFKLRFG